MQLISLFRFIVLLPALVLPEVTPFDNCAKFFAKPGGIVTYPTIFKSNQYKQICQKYNNKYEFATLYNTDDRIPVYSAYLYQGKNTCSCKSTWYIEPQLDDPNDSPEMAPEKDGNGAHQARNSDYNKTGYDRGHLYPVFHTFKQCTADATFTLTNAAPQSPNFNRDHWHKKVERATKNFLDTYCTRRRAFMLLQGSCQEHKS